jgi:L-serine deaminase
VAAHGVDIAPLAGSVGVLGIVDDYDGDYKLLHAVDILIFLFYSFNNPN